MKTALWSLFTIAFVSAVALLIDAKTAISDDRPTDSKVTLERLTYKQLQERLASIKDAKYTLVDIWSTTCGPCKENFPHLVAMHHKYASKGLAVISLSLDDPSDKAACAEALKFLQEKKAEFTNILLDEELGKGYEKLNVSAIPAVIVFGPNGKEVKRFTMDDPNNQFTYDEVEKDVAGMLGQR